MPLFNSIVDRSVENIKVNNVPIFTFVSHNVIIMLKKGREHYEEA